MCQNIIILKNTRKKFALLRKLYFNIALCNIFIRIRNSSGVGNIAKAKVGRAKSRHADITALPVDIVAGKLQKENCAKLVVLQPFCFPKE